MTDETPKCTCPLAEWEALVWLVLVYVAVILLAVVISHRG